MHVEQDEIELFALEARGEGVQLETWHTHAEGMVARSIRIPAGVALSGARHLADHIASCFGDISVMTEEGVQRLRGYHVLPAAKGLKRVGFTHADTIFTTYHLNPTNERDPGRIEAMLVEHPEQLQRRRVLPQPQRETALCDTEGGET